MFLEQSHVFFWKFCEDPTWFGWDIKLNFKTRPGNLDNARPFVSGYLTISMLASLGNVFLWRIFSVTTLRKSKNMRSMSCWGWGWRHTKLPNFILCCIFSMFCHYVLTFVRQILYYLSYYISNNRRRENKKYMQTSGTVIEIFFLLI